jgi:diguanylate cyclase (GGDEF)-like protein
MEDSAPKTSYEEPLSAPDGTPRWVETSKVPLRDFSGAVIGVLGTYQDITARKHAERELERQANYDALTGLPNRNLLTERIAHEIAAAKRAQGIFAVAVVDLDNFKLANDGHGHAFGDRLLVEAAARLQATVRSDDTVARYGGDEFVLLLSCRGDERFAVVLERVRAAFSMPIVIDRTEVFVTCSIGASTFPQDGLDAATLLSHADTAMYRAKEGGRNRFEVFEAEMGNRIRERISLEHGLRAALAEGQLLLNYQPQVNLETGRVDGVEALTRWKHPTQGMISPARFIPVAEQSGLIIPMGEWILRTGCAHAKAWNDQTGSPLSVAVNLSALQFRQKGFVELVARTLAETGLPAEHLELEITESLLMSEDALGLLLELKKLGISLSIDDFGTGYSSLSYLRRLPIDKLKIDQSFVRDIPNDASAISIARAIILLSQSLGFSVIAEGVETKEQLEVLQALGCDEIQGYYFSKPVTDEELPRVRDDIQRKLNARAKEVTIEWPREPACRTA